MSDDTIEFEVDHLVEALADDRTYQVDLTTDEMTYLHNALYVYMEEQAELAQGNHWLLVTVGPEGKVISRHPASDIFVSQYIDVRTLRKKLVDLVGRDLTDD